MENDELMYGLFCEDCGELFTVFLDDDDDVYVGCQCSVDPLDVFMEDLDDAIGDIEVVEDEAEDDSTTPDDRDGNLGIH